MVNIEMACNTAEVHAIGVHPNGGGFEVVRSTSLFGLRRVASVAQATKHPLRPDASEAIFDL